MAISLFVFLIVLDIFFPGNVRNFNTEGTDLLGTPMVTAVLGVGQELLRNEARRKPLTKLSICD